MPRVDLTLSVPLTNTPRAYQLRGMFDLPEVKLGAVTFSFDAPTEDRPWQVGLIVGPSGAGKSSVARHLFGDDIVEGYAWPADVPVIDGFGGHDFDAVTGALKAAGFRAPAAWLRPFSALSNGEQFRATLARVLLDDRPRIVIDEFTSVVDRAAARVGAEAVAAAVRARPGRQFIAVACHDDLVPWLRPDWIIEPHAARFVWTADGGGLALHRTSFDSVIQRERGAVTFKL